LASSRTQRASTAADGASGLLGAGITGIFRSLFNFLDSFFVDYKRDLTPAGIVDTMAASHHD
jgi:hypothetical protein